MMNIEYILVAFVEWQAGCDKSDPYTLRMNMSSCNERISSMKRTMSPSQNRVTTTV